MANYINYHSHSHYSNISTPDCTISNEDRVKRTIELGQSTCGFLEHGWVGRFIEGIELSKKYHVKPLLGSEIYWVKDRHENDRTNSHVIVIAKNEDGRKELNWAISEANVSGYYYKARLDYELLFGINPNNVWVTSSCLGGVWKYDDADDIILKFNQHFGLNFFLEVQAHDTPEQKELNQRIVNLSKKHNIKMIAGMDSHMIYPSQSKERDDYLLSRGIEYPEETGWYLDFPSYDEAKERFEIQDVLNNNQISEALDNTNIFESVEEYDSIIFDSGKIKLPTIYPSNTQNEKDEIFENLIWNLWSIEKDNVPETKWKHYEEQIQKELDTIIETGMADYFLLNYEVVKKGKELGGSITLTGRGSSPSFFIVKLLGLTTIDRISASVRLFPERFISKERLLETKSLPDFDFNLGTPKIFAEAQVQIMGEGRSYPMIAFGTTKNLSAWKLYARSAGVDFETSNLVSEQLTQFEFDLKHADDEDKEKMDVLTYIDPSLHEIFKESRKYLGLVNSLTIHPCFVAGTKILTLNGYKSIEKINVGDSVFTHNNRYKKVKEVMKNKSSNIYELRVGLNKTIVTGNHPIFVKKMNNKYNEEKKYSNPQWVSVEELFNNTQSHTGKYGEGYKVGYPINNKSITPKNDFLPVEEKDFWWLIGRYLGDGWTYKPKDRTEYRIIISANKKTNEHLLIMDRIKNIFKSRFSEERTSCKVYINNKYLFEFLEMFGKYAEHKFIPNFVLDLPKDLIESLLEGYFSADGHIGQNGKIIFSTVSENLALGIQSCVHKTGKNCTISRNREKRIEFIENRKVNCLPQYMGQISLKNETHVNRKQWNDGKYAWYNIDYIKKTDLKNKFVYNFEVENDHSYTVNNMAVHNCAYLLSDFDIRREFGLIKIKTGETENICACCDGLFAEQYKLLKNDLLKVAVVDLIYRVYARIGMTPHPLPELLKICEGNEKVWNIYKNACGMGINQIEQSGTVGRVAKYAPQNISEISAFVAAIRPGFKSNYKQFEAREKFEYGIPTLDKLIQTEEFPQSYMLYQENAMQVMAYAGIPVYETYDVIKNIAKKRVAKVVRYKEQFIDGMRAKLINDEKVSLRDAEEISNMTWQIIEDSSFYSFNCSHSYSVAGDSLYGAYLKSHYPYEFYEVFLQMLEEDGDKDRLTKTKIEAEKHFGIKFPPYRFGQDNRGIIADKENKTISSSLKSIKSFNHQISEDLFEASKKQYKSFVEFLIYAEENGFISSKFEKLIRIKYFEKFGKNKKLLLIWEEFKTGKNRYNKKLTDKSKEKRIDALIEFEKTVENENISFREQIDSEQEILGYIQAVYPTIDKKYIYVSDLNDKYAPRIQTYSINNGTQISLKIYKKTYERKPFSFGDILYCKSFEKKFATKFIDGQYVENKNEVVWWLTDYEVISDIDKIISPNSSKPIEKVEEKVVEKNSDTEPKEIQYLVFDTETGGLDANRHALCSIACVTLDKDLNEVDRYYTLVNEPNKLIEDVALNINGLTREEISQGKPIEQVLDEIRNLMQGKILVAHNAKFDAGFLNARGFDIKESIDTMMISRKLNPKEPAKLSAVCERLKIEVKDTHNSLGDVLLTAQVLKKFSQTQWLNVLEPKPIGKGL